MCFILIKDKQKALELLKQKINIVIKDTEIKILEAEFIPSKVKVIGAIVEITKNSFGITCEDGIIYLKKIKPSGKKIMDITSFINGIKKEEYLGKVIK